jgi:methionyl-tRNA formyltransferase
VKQVAIEAQLALLQPASLKNDALQTELASVDAEAWVVAAYGLIVPPRILAAPRLGCLNIHASVLPRWRGAAPIQRALMAGDAETGVSIMQMDEGLDTGPVLMQRAIPISTEDTAATLHDRLALLGARLIIEALDGLEAGALRAVPQSTEGVTYAAKLGPEDAKVDWSQPARSVAQMIRALDPSPGAQTRLREQSIKLWRARAHDKRSAEPPGTVLAVDSGEIRVACGDGVLSVTELQRAGGKRLAAGDFMRGFAIRIGERFGC